MLSNVMLNTLLDDSVVRNFRTTASDEKTYNVKCYNLDMIIAIGYRLNRIEEIIYGKNVELIFDGELDDSTTEESSVVQIEDSSKEKILKNIK